MIFKLFGFCLLLGCLGVVYLFEGAAIFTGALRIIHPPAIFLTLVGPMALIFVCSDFSTFWYSLGTLLGASSKKRHRKHLKEAVVLQNLSKSFYQDGAKAFETVKVKNLSPFFMKTIERLSIRMPIGDIKELLESERDRTQVKMVQSMGCMGLGVRLTPSVGMLGTILGMVQLLSTLNDPSKIGSHMSLALLTTFYGLFFSLAVWTPFQQKIERVLDEELNGFNQVLRWLELLEKRKPANYFADSVGIPSVGGSESKKPAEAA